MCFTCYKEAGSPAIINEKTKKAASLIKDLYEQEGCDIGGYAHIVTDDWNIDDSCIDFCIDESEKGEHDYISEDGRNSCIETLNYIKELNEDERYSSLALFKGFISGE